MNVSPASRSASSTSWKRRPRSNRVLVTAIFDLDGDDTLVVHGVAERIEHNDRPSFRGRLGVGGGTGKFKGRRGQVDVDVCNPKRWIVDGGP